MIAQTIATAGGFGGSRYLHRSLEAHCGAVIPAPDILYHDSREIKSACEGAALWFLARLVRARACRAHYGLNTSVAYDPVAEPDHRSRPTLAWPDGRRYVAGRWGSLAEKDAVVDETNERLAHFVRQYAHPEDLLRLGAFSLSLLVRPACALPGTETTLIRPQRCESPAAPRWCALTSEAPYHLGIVAACTLHADLRSLRRALVPRTVAGRTFYELKFRVAVCCRGFGALGVADGMGRSASGGQPCRRGYVGLSGCVALAVIDRVS
jgi:hypothetical protein